MISAIPETFHHLRKITAMLTKNCLSIHVIRCKITARSPRVEILALTHNKIVKVYSLAFALGVIHTNFAVQCWVIYITTSEYSGTIQSDKLSDE